MASRSERQRQRRTAAAENRGGPRQGAQGTAYPERTDMNQNRQPVRTAPSQQYGEATQQAQAQSAMPLPDQTQLPQPGSLGPLHGPTARPAEPLTAGLNTGPGPGPEALGMNTPQMSPLDELRAIFAAYPTPELRRLIEYSGG